MARTAVLFVDLLGVQKMWVAGGAPKVRARVSEFNQFIRKQFDVIPSELHRGGDYTVFLYSDSAAVACQDPDQAIGIGKYLFSQAFFYKEVPYLWLRGAIAPWANQHEIASTSQFLARKTPVGTQYILEDAYLDVTALEKSGFKGMRLVINPNLVPNRAKVHCRKWGEFKRPLHTVCRLEKFSYPADNLADVLWMADDEKKFEQLKAIMDQRFKRASADPEEFVQASWTRAVFDQVNSLVWACRQL